VNKHQPDLQSLQQALLLAHEQHNHADLIRLYAEAATSMETNGDIDAACFYLTQAYVYAMESGTEAQAQSLHNQLAKYGRVTQN